MLDVNYEGLGGTGLVTTPLIMAPNLSECNVSHGGIAQKQFWRDKFRDFYETRQDFLKILVWLGVHSKWWVQQQRKHAWPGSVLFWE